jgi:Carboxypeptidase regulatory-like domain/TonB-dependent Receptor Plug Domain
MRRVAAWWSLLHAIRRELISIEAMGKTRWISRGGSEAFAWTDCGVVGRPGGIPVRHFEGSKQSEVSKNPGVSMNSIHHPCAKRPVAGTTQTHLSFGTSLLKVILMALGLLAAPAAFGQNTGSIFGNVQDQTGAAIANGTVTATDAAHGVTRTGKVNATGEFLLNNLPVGSYTLTVGAASFANEVITDIKVDANSNIKEIVQLSPGTDKQSVTVTDTSGSVIDPKSATLGTLIDQRLIEDLPIDGHNVVALSALLPGVVNVNAPSTFTGDTAGPTYSASGSRNTQNLLLFDGLMWNNLFFNTGVNFPPPNALQEVSVLLNNFKAQYGRNAGSVFNVLTRSGSNRIHGAVWDYIQNQYFNAADYITKVNPQDDQNQFGFTVGGPLMKDKLFYFGAYQQLIGHLLTTGSAPTPGYAERGLLPDGKTPRPCTSPGPFVGLQCANFLNDVTSITNGVSSVGRLINPLDVTPSTTSTASPELTMSDYNTAWQQAGGTGQSPCLALLSQANATAANTPYFGLGVQGTYLPNAELPIQCINPVMLNVVNQLVPLPGQNGFAVSTSPAPTSDKNATVRLDYNLNGANTIDARYNGIISTSQTPPGVNNQSVGIATYGLVSSRAVSNFGNVGLQTVLSPALLNSLRIGYKRFETKQFPIDHRTLSSFGGNFYEPGIPSLPSINFNTFSVGSTSDAFQDHINENVELREALSWTKGNHNIQFGFSFLRLQYLTRAQYSGQIAYGNAFTAVALVDALGGLANSVSAQNELIQGGIQHDVFTWFQDDWRASPKMTLNLGLRYELPFQWFQPHGQSATFVPGQQSTVFPNAPGGLVFPGDRGVLPSLAPTDFHGIAPRVGFAYDVNGTGKFLIRGGYGVFFDAINANVIGVGQPFHYIFSYTLPPGGGSVPLATFGVDANGTPNGTVLQIPTSFDPKHPEFIAPYSIFFPDPNFRTPYVMAANLGFQYHISHAGVLDTNYVGKFARKLTIPLDLNPAIYSCDPTSGAYQADPVRYCQNANSSNTSELARVRYVPFNFGGQGIVDILSAGTSNYNALQVQYTQRGGKYLTVFGSYTYSKSMDWQTNGQTTSNTVPDVFNLPSDYGPSDSNVTHNLTMGWVLRFPKVTSSNRILEQVLNNWIYSGQYLAHTGLPFSVTENGDQALDGEPNQRAGVVANKSPKLPSNRHRADKVQEYFNRDAFTYTQVGTFSPLSRNSMVGPGYIMTNMTMGRDFPLTGIREGMRLNLRGEAFNVFNTPNLANPNAQFSCSTTSVEPTVTTSGVFEPGVSCPSTTTVAGAVTTTPGSYSGTVNGIPKFGQVLSTQGNNGNTSTNGRKMQIALTLFF